MNPVWERIHIAQVREGMVETLGMKGVSPLTIALGLKRFVVSQARPNNLGDFANAHNNRLNGRRAKADIFQVKGDFDRQTIDQFGSTSPPDMPDHYLPHSDLPEFSDTEEYDEDGDLIRVIRDPSRLV
jgi:hypothetical protein